MEESYFDAKIIRDGNVCCEICSTSLEYVARKMIEWYTGLKCNENVVILITKEPKKV